MINQLLGDYYWTNLTERINQIYPGEIITVPYYVDTHDIIINHFFYPQTYGYNDAQGNALMTKKEIIELINRTLPQVADGFISNIKGIIRHYPQDSLTEDAVKSIRDVDMLFKLHSALGAWIDAGRQDSINDEIMDILND